MDVLHTLGHFIVYSPLMSFNWGKLNNTPKLQNPKLLLERQPAMFQSSKVVQAFSSAQQPVLEKVTMTKQVT